MVKNALQSNREQRLEKEEKKHGCYAQLAFIQGYVQSLHQ